MFRKASIPSIWQVRTNWWIIVPIVTGFFISYFFALHTEWPRRNCFKSSICNQTTLIIHCDNLFPNSPDIYIVLYKGSLKGNLNFVYLERSSKLCGIAYLIYSYKRLLYSIQSVFLPYYRKVAWTRWINGTRFA